MEISKYKIGDRVEFFAGSIKGSGTLLGIVTEFAGCYFWTVKFDVSIFTDDEEIQELVLSEDKFKLV